MKTQRRAAMALFMAIVTSAIWIGASSSENKAHASRRPTPVIYVSPLPITTRVDLESERYYGPGLPAYDGFVWDWCRDAWLDYWDDALNLGNGFGWQTRVDRCVVTTAVGRMNRSIVPLLHTKRLDFPDDDISQMGATITREMVDNTVVSAAPKDLVASIRTRDGKVTVHRGFWGLSVGVRGGSLLHEASHRWSGRGHGADGSDFSWETRGAWFFEVWWYQRYVSLEELPQMARCLAQHEANAILDHFFTIHPGFDVEEVPDCSL